MLSIEMAQTKEQHLDALLGLPPHERSIAAEKLLVSLEDSPVADSVQEAWLDELARRVDANADGISAETVFAEGRTRLRGQ